MPWVPVPTWKGTTAEATDLNAAIVHNCACDVQTRCGAHQAMLEQRFLDTILFMRWMRARLQEEEGLCLDI